MTQALWDNPMGTDGFEFIEYAAPDPVAMGKVFESLGFTAIAKHRTKDVTLYRQGDINFIINAEKDSFAQRFARLHGPSICAFALRVQDANTAYRRALELGAWGFDNQCGPMVRGTSMICRTPGTASAASRSYAAICARRVGARAMIACNAPSYSLSLPNIARPVTMSAPSMFEVGCPTIP